MIPYRYHHLSARTRPTLSRRDMISMAALGIGGEGSEVLDTISAGNTRDNRIKELGDVCWYIATLADALGMNPEAVWTLGTEPLTSTWYNAAFTVAIDAGRVVEAAKKHLYHDKPDTPIRAGLIRLAASVRSASGAVGVSIEDIWAANVAKLRERHPDGFSPDYPPETVPVALALRKGLR